MGVSGLQKFLQTDVPNGYCWEVDVKKLADEYRNETGREPVVLIDGPNCLRSPCLRSSTTDELLLGGQMQEFINTMKNFVAAFQNIGVRVVFFFDGTGMTQESKRGTWLFRRQQKINQIVRIFKDLDNTTKVTSQNLQGMLPALVGAVGHFVAKYVCDCDVYVCVSECDIEMAHFAQKEGCFAILSQDTDFVILQGARYILTAEELTLETMTTLTYSREGLLKFLGLQPQQLFLLASLLGNDTIPVSKLKNFHKRVTQTQNMLLPCVVEYVKKWHFSGSYDDEELRTIARDVFRDDNMAADLSTSIGTYLPPSTGVEEGTVVDDIHDGKWLQILEVAEKKHRSCQVPYLYGVILRKAYQMSVCLEDYRKSDLKHVAKIYQPLRQRIYGVLFNEKPTVTTVKEWCVESTQVPREPTDVPVVKFPSIEKYHPGLLELWGDMCKPYTRWRLFAESLTQGKKLNAEELEKLGLPYVVPVAVLFYLLNECEGIIDEERVDVILAQGALVKFCSPEELRAITYQYIKPEVIHLSTIFNRGVTTVLFLLSACGFDIKEAMPWLYFDGKLFQQKHIQRRMGVRQEQLCNDRRDALRTFREMKRLVLPPTSWR